jgi:sulfite reductase beta subunit-like hemoprotein
VKNILYVSINMSLYGYGYEGMGYRYPRRKREVKTKLSEPTKYARAAIYNVGAARVNPWIDFLRKEHVYDEIREIFNRVRNKYKAQPKDPERAKRARERELEMLEEEYQALNDDLSTLVPAYTSKYGTTLSFENARLAAEAKLRKRATDLMRMTGKQSKIIPPITEAELKQLREAKIL